MNCKRLKATILGNFYKAVLSKNIFKATLLPLKQFKIAINQSSYRVVSKNKGYNVSFCISYRPLGSLERILARGRRNDKGIWTENGIFNDGKI